MDHVTKTGDVARARRLSMRRWLLPMQRPFGCSCAAQASAVVMLLLTWAGASRAQWAVPPAAAVVTVRPHN
eukprot:362012-Chlamydomonas_euryale.AAC.3